MARLDPLQVSLLSYTVNNCQSKKTPLAPSFVVPETEGAIMRRIAIPVMFVIAVFIALLVGTPVRSNALTASASPQPTAAPLPPPPDLCQPGEPLIDDVVDARPPGLDEAAVNPAAEWATPATPGTATPTAETPRELYLVAITLPPGRCIPYTSVGNQKDGAIVMIVQQGKVQYRWGPAIPGSTPIVTIGDSADTLGNPAAGSTQTLFPGDWVTQDQQVWFTYRNVGGDSAVILKAVWAVPEIDQGCGGGCK